jgi:hypothetical protein
VASRRDQAAAGQRQGNKTRPNAESPDDFEMAIEDLLGQKV